MRVLTSEFCSTVWALKTRMVSLWGDKRSMYNCIYRISERRIDRQTDRHHITVSRVSVMST